MLLHFICEIQFENQEFKDKAESTTYDNTQWVFIY
jgi:hypothetical protein